MKNQVCVVELVPYGYAQLDKLIGIAEQILTITGGTVRFKHNGLEYQVREGDEK